MEDTRPSQIGPEAWARLAGPWEIDYSYANMRAIEEHPFNDSIGPRTFWWLVRYRGRVLGTYSGYVTETYNFAKLFAVGRLRKVATYGDRLYLWLDRRGLYAPLDRIGVGRIIRVTAGRIRVMFLGAHTADVGGQGVGVGFREHPPSVYMPAIARMIDAQARALGVEQITFREVSEQDAGPFTFPNLWEAKGPEGRRVLEANGYTRDPGFPAAYVDLRAIAKRFPGDGDAVYRFYRHADADAFIGYGEARAGWLAGARKQLDADPAAVLSMDFIATHPGSERRAETSRLAVFRNQLFRAGIMPPVLVELAQLDRAEGELKNLRRTVRRLRRLEPVAAALRRRMKAESAGLPQDASPDVYERAFAELERVAQAHELSTLESAWATTDGAERRASQSVVRRIAELRRQLAGRTGSVPDVAGDADVRISQLRRLVEARAREQGLIAETDPEFRVLPSDVRRKLVDLAAGRIRQVETEERRLLLVLGWTPGASAADSASYRAQLDRYLALAAAEAGADRELRKLRTEIDDLARRTGVAPQEAGVAIQALDLLARYGGTLPNAVEDTVARANGLRKRLADAEVSLAAGNERLTREAAKIQRLLLVKMGPEVRQGLERSMAADFRNEQDRIAAEHAGGIRSGSPMERRARLEAALSYAPLNYPRLLLGDETLRNIDRRRLLDERRRHQSAVRAVHPEQPGPDMPEFDDQGYLARGLWFSGRDERVWVDLADQDRITALYHAVMSKSLIRHDVMDWPYYFAYREAGRASHDELHFATLRAGGPTGPIVAAVSVKRSPAGHFRPERIALAGIDFGAYHALVILTMANELRLGGSFCSLGQTSQGTKLRDFGAAFVDAHEYTRFRGLVPVFFRLDRARRAAFKTIHVDRILEIAALPPELREQASREHGIRWHI